VHAIGGTQPAKLIFHDRFLLRRAAVRAISATPSKAFLAKPRSIATFSPSTLRTQQQQFSIAFQRRFASDDAAKTEAAAADTPENFAQTAAEPPMEDGLTPAQQDAQAEPTNAEATIGADALEQVAKVAERSSRERPARKERSSEAVPPHKMLYIGNLYYEVTAEQLKTVFSRFGEVASVKIVYDNRGLSRG
jgi:nucleolin